MKMSSPPAVRWFENYIAIADDGVVVGGCGWIGSVVKGTGRCGWWMAGASGLIFLDGTTGYNGDCGAGGGKYGAGSPSALLMARSIVASSGMLIALNVATSWRTSSRKRSESHHGRSAGGEFGGPGLRHGVAAALPLTGRLSRAWLVTYASAFRRWLGAVCVLRLLPLGLPLIRCGFAPAQTICGAMVRIFGLIKPLPLAAFCGRSIGSFSFFPSWVCTCVCMVYPLRGWITSGLVRQAGDVAVRAAKLDGEDQIHIGRCGAAGAVVVQGPGDQSRGPSCGSVMCSRSAQRAVEVGEFEVDRRALNRRWPLAVMPSSSSALVPPCPIFSVASLLLLATAATSNNLPPLLDPLGVHLAHWRQRTVQMDGVTNDCAVHGCSLEACDVAVDAADNEREGAGRRSERRFGTAWCLSGDGERWRRPALAGADGNFWRSAAGGG